MSSRAEPFAGDYGSLTNHQPARAQPGWRIPPEAARRKNLAPAPALPPFGGRISETFKVSSSLGWDAPEDLHCDDTQITSSLHEEFWDVILKSSWLNTRLHLSHQCNEEACLHLVGAGYWNPPQPGVRTRGDVGMTAETKPVRGGCSAIA